MARSNSGARRRGGNTGRKSKNSYVTKSGQTIKINRSLGDRLRAYRENYSQKNAARLAGMPKGRVKRFFWRLRPKHLYEYWFSRQGGIMALKVVGIGALVSFLLLVAVFAYFRKDLPDITNFPGNNIGGSIQYYDRTGQTLLWEDFDAVKRIPVKDTEISNNIRKATVAIEDKDFYKHGGFDVRGIARAGINNVFGHGSTQGGSTITQQLIKLSLNWTDQRTYARKLKEIILSVELEREYNKDQILTGYLNVAPYGNIEYGVEAASSDYFHKSAKDLTVDEAAFLAAIPKSPSIYSPYGPYFDKPTLVGRQHYVIDQMVDQHMITKDDGEAAKKVDTMAKVQPQQSKYTGIKAPYFALAAKSEIESRYGTETANRGGWKVITTMDMRLQTLAEDSVQKDIPTLHRYGADEAAFAAEDIKTGQMVALVGGVDFNNADHGKINYAHDTFIAPGSSFKPYDYAALIDKSTNVGAGSVLYDSKGPLPGYPCTDQGLPPPKGHGNCLQDYDFRTPGPMTLRYALGGSRNIPAVKANLIVGTDNVINMADKMMANPYNPKPYQCYETGDTTFTKPTQCYGASAIGDGAFLHLDDHVNGLATLARLGSAIPRTYILKISTQANPNFYNYKQPKAEQVIRPDSAYIVNDMASDPNASYLPSSYKFQRFKGWNFAVKTGTTNNGFDGLMASWSTKYAAVSWVGYHTRNQALTGAMEYMTEPITRPWMEGAHDASAGTPTNWEKPSGVKTLPAYVVRTHVGIGSVEPSPSTDLFPSWYTPPKAASGASQNIDIVSNKLATECTPQLAIKQVNNADVNTFSVDKFVNNGNATNQKDDVHSCDDVKPSLDPLVLNGDGSVTVVVHKGSHDLSSDQFKGTVNFIANGQTVKSVQVDSDGQTATLPAGTAPAGSTVTAQIIDSVLYDSSSPNSVTVPGGTASNPLTITSAKQTGTKSKFTWSGGSGTVTIKRSDGTTLCQDSADSSCTTSGAVNPAPAGTTVHAEDSNGKSPDVVVSS